MGFKFGLQVLLKHKKRLEENARREYMEAQARLNLSLEKIELMWKDISVIRKNMESEQIGGGKKIEYLASLDGFIKGHKIRIEREKIVLRELNMLAEEKRELLIEASRDFKIIEKIREKRELDYKSKKRKKEAKELDDIVTTRYKRNS